MKALRLAASIAILSCFATELARGESAETNTVSAQSIASDLGYEKAHQPFLLALFSKVDDRPLYVDEALFAIEFKKNRWRLVHVYRHPKDEDETHRKWKQWVANDAEAIGKKDFRHKPSKSDVVGFLRASGWRPHSANGFRIVRCEVFTNTWKTVLDYEPPIETLTPKPQE